MGKSGYTQEFELDRGGRGSQRKSAQVSTSGGQAEPRSAPRTRARAGGRLVERPTFVHSVGILLLGLYWISGYATDLSHRLLSEKPYLSMISGVGLYVVVVFSGRMLRGVRTTIGKYWLFLIAWMIVATAFSTWRGGSLSFLGNYIPKIHLIFFLVCAFVVTVRHCRILIYANVIKGFVLLLTCVLEGRPDPINGRFTIPGSWIGGNPNELAIELLMCSAFFMFLLFRRNVGVRLLGVIGVTTALAYVLKTGSRGGLLTLGMFLVGVFIFSRQRWKVAMIALPLAVAALSISGDLWRRMTLIAVDPTDTSQAMSTEDVGSLGSQFARQELLKQSVWFMVTKPVFGVGPGRFVDAMWGYAVEEGEWVHPQGTHNGYTQVGSESGLPALYAFVATLFLSLRLSYRLYRRTCNDSALAEVSAMALCLVGALVVYMGSAMFHHIAFSMYPAMLAGLAVSLAAAAQPLVEARESNGEPESGSLRGR